MTPKINTVDRHRQSGLLGVSSVLLFAAALIVFGNLNPTFDFLEDFVSKLGALGEPYAWLWNIIGFGIVGGGLFGFGILYGSILSDKLAGLLLAMFGLGFALTSFPVDLADSNAAVSKAHIVAICLALAFWLFGLARISYNPALSKGIRTRANITAALIIISMVGSAAGMWSMPLTHRLVFAVVFGWTMISSIEVLYPSRTKS
jgi:hypothetical membrane protein